MDTTGVFGHDAALVGRIQAEFREMPGLRLTLAQACRLWGLDVTSCESILGRLLDEGFLRRTTDGAYVALPQVRPTPLDAGLQAVTGGHRIIRRV
jgi:hypothetical protein